MIKLLRELIGEWLLMRALDVLPPTTRWKVALCLKPYFEKQAEIARGELKKRGR